MENLNSEFVLSKISGFPKIQTGVMSAIVQDSHANPDIARKIVYIPAISDSVDMLQIMDMFYENQDNTFFPIVNDSEEPVGLVREYHLKEYVYSQFGRNVLENPIRKKHVERFVSPCMNADIGIATGDILKDEYIRNCEEGIVITQYGKYVGFLTANSLLDLFHEYQMKLVEEHNQVLAWKNKLLDQKNRDIQSMLQNMQQGIFTILEGNIIHPEYSRHLEQILEMSDIADQSVMAVLFAQSNLGCDQLNQVEVALGCILGQDQMFFDCNRHVLLSEFCLNLNYTQKVIELDWNPILNDLDEVEKILVVVRDVTRLRELQSESSQQKRELEIIGQILKTSQENFYEFVQNAEQLIKANRDILEQGMTHDLEVLNTLFRNMHTIKGNARTYGLQYITNQVHETENTYDGMRKAESLEWDMPLLRSQLDATWKIIREYADISEQKLMRKGPGRRGNVDRFLMVEKEIINELMNQLKLLEEKSAANLGQYFTYLQSSNPEHEPLLNALEQTTRDILQLQNLIKPIGSTSIAEILEGNMEALESLSRDLNKRQPEVHIRDHGILIKNQVAGLVRNAFGHVLRNSMDHGIETPEERVMKGKSPEGQISIDVKLDENNLKFSYRDDGRGLNLERIHQKALAANILQENETYSSTQIAQLIFHSGLSTASKVTEVSGRGVGMDAVKNLFQREKGDVTIRLLEPVEQSEFVPFELILILPRVNAVQLVSV
ncbi:MAG: Hpt domain-containing protein [SAR324 cluster bacterium]|nr:Hpt domain-containing protein [SAR324 cluster bacterium]